MFGIPGNFRLLYLHVTCELARYKAVKVMLHGRFVTAIFSATQRCNRPIRLIQCCTHFKSPGVEILCVLYLHYNVAFTF